MRDQFDREVADLVRSTQRHNIMTQSEYLIILNEVEEATAGKSQFKPLTSKHYRKLNRYDIISISGNEKLIQKRIKESDSHTLKYFIPSEEMFDVIHQAHLDTGHKRNKGMEEELKKKYANITREVINALLKLCEACQLKKKSAKTGIVL